MIDYRCEQRGAVTSIWFDICGGWEQWLFFVSDNHHDSIYCNRDLELAHLEEAKRRGALVFVFGDLFDAMQGRFDPRRSMDELRPEYRREDYYDFVVRDLAEFLQPFAENIAVIADGNHEMSVLKNANTNLADRLVYELNRGGVKTVHGGYGGYVRFMFNLSNGERTGPRTSVKLKYFHGAGGEAPVTRGAIQTNRQAVYLPDADIVVNGHNHNNYHIPIARERLSNKGELYFDIQHHIRTPGYKQSYGDGSGGWDVTRGGVPKPIGGVWCKMGMKNGAITLTFEPAIEAPIPVSVNEFSYDGPVFAQDSEYP